MTWALFDHDVQTKAIVEMLDSNSERVLAVVGGALLDEHVNRTLSERLRDDHDRVGRLLGVYGALGNLGPKIDVLYLLYGIDHHTREALNGLTEVRNFFAHNLETSFDSLDDRFLNGMGKLKLHNNRAHYPDIRSKGESVHKIESVKNKRGQFTVNLKIGLAMLMRDRLSHKKWSNAPREP